jgi:hypothetical protein
MRPSCKCEARLFGGQLFSTHDVSPVQGEPSTLIQGDSSRLFEGGGFSEGGGVLAPGGLGPRQYAETFREKSSPGARWYWSAPDDGVNSFKRAVGGSANARILFIEFCLLLKAALNGVRVTK